MGRITEPQFEAIFDRHSPAVLSYLVRRTDRATAEDALSETFLVAWRRRDDLPDDALPWLYGVARRVLANELRGTERRSALRARLAEAGAGQPALPGGFELSDSVHAALLSLSGADREVLCLTAWEELSREEAAIVLNCRPATYSVRLHRAAQRFRKALAAQRSAPAERATRRSEVAS